MNWFKLFHRIPKPKRYPITTGVPEYDQYDHLIMEHVRVFNLDPFSVKAVIATRSHFDCNMEKEGKYGLFGIKVSEHKDFARNEDGTLNTEILTTRPRWPNSAFNPDYNIVWGCSIIQEDILSSTYDTKIVSYLEPDEIVKFDKWLMRFLELIKSYKGEIRLVPDPVMD